MSKPVQKIVYRDKDSKQRYECAAIWPTEGFDWSFNLQPHTETTDGKYPRMPLTLALKNVAEKKGFINVVMVGENRIVAGEAQEYDGF